MGYSAAPSLRAASLSGQRSPVRGWGAAAENNTSDAPPPADGSNSPLEASGGGEEVRRLISVGSGILSTAKPPSLLGSLPAEPSSSAAVNATNNSGIVSSLGVNRVGSSVFGRTSSRLSTNAAAPAAFDAAAVGAASQHFGALRGGAADFGGLGAERVGDEGEALSSAVRSRTQSSAIVGSRPASPLRAASFAYDPTSLAAPSASSLNAQHQQQQPNADAASNGSILRAHSHSQLYPHSHSSVGGAGAGYSSSLARALGSRANSPLRGRAGGGDEGGDSGGSAAVAAVASSLGLFGALPSGGRSGSGAATFAGHSGALRTAAEPKPTSVALAVGVPLHREGMHHWGREGSASAHGVHPSVPSTVAPSPPLRPDPWAPPGDNGVSAAAATMPEGPHAESHNAAGPSASGATATARGGEEVQSSVRWRGDVLKVGVRHQPGAAPTAKTHPRQVIVSEDGNLYLHLPSSSDAGAPPPDPQSATRAIPLLSIDEIVVYEPSSLLLGGGGGNVAYALPEGFLAAVQHAAEAKGSGGSSSSSSSSADTFLLDLVAEYYPEEWVCKVCVGESGSGSSNSTLPLWLAFSSPAAGEAFAEAIFNDVRAITASFEAAVAEVGESLAVTAAALEPRLVALLRRRRAAPLAVKVASRLSAEEFRRLSAQKKSAADAKSVKGPAAATPARSQQNGLSAEGDVAAADGWQRFSSAAGANGASPAPYGGGGAAAAGADTMTPPPSRPPPTRGAIVAGSSAMNQQQHQYTASSAASVAASRPGSPPNNNNEAAAPPYRSHTHRADSAAYTSSLSGVGQQHNAYAAANANGARPLPPLPDDGRAPSAGGGHYMLSAHAPSAATSGDFGPHSGDGRGGDAEAAAALAAEEEIRRLRQQVAHLEAARAEVEAAMAHQQQQMQQMQQQQQQEAYLNNGGGGGGGHFNAANNTSSSAAAAASAAHVLAPPAPPNPLRDDGFLRSLAASASEPQHRVVTDLLAATQQRVREVEAEAADLRLTVEAGEAERRLLRSEIEDLQRGALERLRAENAALRKEKDEELAAVRTAFAAYDEQVQSHVADLKAKHEGVAEGLKRRLEAARRRAEELRQHLLRREGAVTGGGPLTRGGVEGGGSDGLLWAALAADDDMFEDEDDGVGFGGGAGGATPAGPLAKYRAQIMGENGPPTNTHAGYAPVNNSFGGAAIPSTPRGHHHQQKQQQPQSLEEITRTFVDAIRNAPTQATSALLSLPTHQRSSNNNNFGSGGNNLRSSTGETPSLGTSVVGNGSPSASLPPSTVATLADYNHQQQHYAQQNHAGPLAGYQTTSSARHNPPVNSAPHHHPQQQQRPQPPPPAAAEDAAVHSLLAKLEHFIDLKAADAAAQQSLRRDEARFGLLQVTADEERRRAAVERSLAAHRVRRAADDERRAAEEAAFLKEREAQRAAARAACEADETVVEIDVSDREYEALYDRPRTAFVVRKRRRGGGGGGGATAAHSRTAWDEGSGTDDNGGSDGGGSGNRHHETSQRQQYHTQDTRRRPNAAAAAASDSAYEAEAGEDRPSRIATRAATLHNGSSSAAAFAQQQQRRTVTPPRTLGAARRPRGGVTAAAGSGRSPSASSVNNNTNAPLSFGGHAHAAGGSGSASNSRRGTPVRSSHSGGGYGFQQAAVARAHQSLATARASAQPPAAASSSSSVTARPLSPSASRRLRANSAVGGVHTAASSAVYPPPAMGVPPLNEASPTRGPRLLSHPDAASVGHKGSSYAPGDASSYAVGGGRESFYDLSARPAPLSAADATNRVSRLASHALRSATVGGAAAQSSLGLVSSRNGTPTRASGGFGRDRSIL